MGDCVLTSWRSHLDWLQAELFAALRSFEQRFLLKLTWSPVLPTDLTPRQERQHDYAAIRMWHGHAADAKSDSVRNLAPAFCAIG